MGPIPGQANHCPDGHWGQNIYYQGIHGSQRGIPAGRCQGGRLEWPQPHNPSNGRH